MCKYVIITGSVISGIGKGTFSSSLGNLLKFNYNQKIMPVKLEGYLNVDSGTLNPERHGEVFVLNDGTECDLDLGTYERMLNQNLDNRSFLTAGQIFKTIIDKERRGEYLGEDVQFIPHVTKEIKTYIKNLGSDSDIVLVEIGGTVGDIENSYMLEAVRELIYEEGSDNVCLVNLVYILEPFGEQKSKAAQQGLRNLMSMGLKPDVVICRGKNPVSDTIIGKLSIMSNIKKNNIVSLSNTNNIYTIPNYLQSEGVDRLIMEKLDLHMETISNPEWTNYISKFDGANIKKVVAIAGKYTNVHDSYISIIKALEHTAPYYGKTIEIKWIDTDKDTDNIIEEMSCVDGLIVPGGFGSRGVAGKLKVIQWARENDIPFLGICYGFQLAVIEYCHSVLNLNANSTEIDPNTDCPVITLLKEQEDITDLGGTMRLGGYDVDIIPGSNAESIYGCNKINRRFRHRWNLNNDYKKIIEDSGMLFTGSSSGIAKILELSWHKYFVGVQYHPEYTSKPLDPEGSFRGLVRAL